MPLPRRTAAEEPARTRRRPPAASGHSNLQEGAPSPQWNVSIYTGHSYIAHSPLSCALGLLTTSSAPLIAGDLLRSQRVAGNHATLRCLTRLRAFTSAGTLQRQVTVESFDENKIDPDDRAKLNEISSSVVEYNNLCTNQGAGDVEGLRERFRKLQQIDRKIYEWFSTKQVPDLLTVKNARQMRNLLRSTERERDQVVDLLRQKGASIPFEGAPETEVAQLESLWKSLAAQGEGVKLRIRGDAEDQKKLLGRLASIMQTKHGRRFIRYLMERAPKEVSLMFSRVAPTPVKEGAMPGAYAAELRQMGTEEHVDEPGESKLRKVGAADQVAVNLPGTALDFMDWLMEEAARRAPEAPRALKVGTTQYALGKAKEAVAVVSQAEILEDERDKLSTAAGFEVLTPTFITLMHELGHALKIASGGYLLDDEPLKDHFVRDLPEPQKKWWEKMQNNRNMLEELINILGVENPVRQESGLAPREIYQSTRDVIVVNTRDKVQEVLIRDGDSPRYLPEVAEAYTALQNSGITLEKVEEIKRNVNVDRMTPEKQKKRKANYARHLLDQLGQFIQLQKPRDQARIKRTKRYDRLYGRLSEIANNPTLDAQNAPLAKLEEELENFEKDRQTLIEAGKLIKSFQKGGLRSRLAKAVHEGGDIQDYLPWRTK